MPYCALLKVLLLVGACFSTWAAPLRSTSSPQDRRCDGKEQQSRDSNEHPASHHNDKMCISSSAHLASSSLVQESRGVADVLSTAKHEEMKFAVTDAILGHIRQSELFQSSTESYTESTEFTDESLAEEKSQKLLSASPYESLPFVEHTVGEDYAERKVEPSRLPLQPRTERPVKTKLTVEHSDYISLSYSDIEDRRTARPLTNPHPLKQEGTWEVTTINNQFDEQKSSRVISTKTQFSANAFVSQSPRNVNSDVTAITTSGSYDGNPGGSIQDKERLAEVYLFTAAEQDKALVPGLLQPDLTLSSRLVELGDTWTEPVHLQGVEEASVLPLLQDVGTEATMSSEDLPLIFEPLDDVTPSSSSSLASELSVAMVPATGMLEETDQTLSMDTGHSPHQSFPGPSDWPLPWQMSGGENSDTVSSSQMPVRGPFTEADVEHSERTERLQNVLATSVVMLRLSPSPLSATTQKIIDIKSTHPAVLKPVSGLDELESQEDDEKHEYVEDSEEEEEEEEESEEELTEVPVHSPTRPPYILIPPPPVWGQRNQGLIRSWVKLIREKAGYVSGMLAPVGIGIAGALLIVGALYGIRMIHRKRRNSLKHQRRKQPTEVRSGPDQAMLLADSSEDEF